MVSAPVIPPSRTPRPLQAAAAAGLFIASVATICHAAQAQQRLTLHEAIRSAAANNPAVARDAFDTLAAHADRITAGLRPNPMLTLNADLFSSSSPIITPERKQYGLSVGFPFELGGKRDARIAVAESAAATASAEIGETQRQAALDAANAWYDVAAASLDLTAARQARAAVDSLVAVDEDRLRDQVITATQVTRSRIQADEFRLAESEAEYRRMRALRDLAVAVGSNEPVEIDDSDALEWLPAADTSDAVSALEHRSDVETARLQAATARTNETLQQANAVPDVTLQADYMRQQGTPFYGISAVIPLPFFARNQGEIEKAAAQRTQSEYVLQMKRRQALAELRRADAEYRQRHETLERTTALLRSAENVRRTVEYAYRTGNATILDLFDAQRTWFEIQRSHDAAEIDVQRSAVVRALTAGTIAMN